MGYVEDQAAAREMMRYKLLHGGVDPIDIMSLIEQTRPRGQQVQPTEPLKVQPMIGTRSSAVPQLQQRDDNSWGNIGAGLLNSFRPSPRPANQPPPRAPAQTGVASTADAARRGRTLTAPQTVAPAPAPPQLTSYGGAAGIQGLPGSPSGPAAVRTGVDPTMAPGRDFSHVDPQFLKAATEYSRLYSSQGGPYSVTFTSGYRGGSGQSQHGLGNALDMQLIDRKTGQPLPNYQVQNHPEIVKAYQDYANGFKQYLDANYPQLGKEYRWGGYFSGGPGHYGALDLMHHDLGGRSGLGMLGGDFQNGFNAQQARTWGIQPGGGLAGRAPMQPGIPPAAAAPAAGTAASMTTAPAPTTATGGLSPQLLQHVKFWEGYKDHAYNDGSQYSIGYGTRANSPNEVIDEPTASARLISELKNAQGAVNQILPANAPQNVRDALTSFSYNVGTGWTQKGNPLAGAVAAGDYGTAAALMKTYNKAGGQVLPGLTARRNAEANMMTGAPTQAPQQPAAAASGVPPILRTQRPFTEATTTPQPPAAQPPAPQPVATAPQPPAATAAIPPSPKLPAPPAPAAPAAAVAPPPKPAAPTGLAAAHKLLDTKVTDLVHEFAPDQAQNVPGFIGDKTLRQAMGMPIVGGQISSGIKPYLGKLGVTPQDFDRAVKEGPPVPGKQSAADPRTLIMGDPNARGVGNIVTGPDTVPTPAARPADAPQPVPSNFDAANLTPEEQALQGRVTPQISKAVLDAVAPDKGRGAMPTAPAPPGGQPVLPPQPDVPVAPQPQLPQGGPPPTTSPQTYQPPPLQPVQTTWQPPDPVGAQTGPTFVSMTSPWDMSSAAAPATPLPDVSGLGFGGGKGGGGGGFMDV